MVIENTYPEGLDEMTVYDAYPNLYMEQKINQLLIFIFVLIIVILIIQKFKNKKINKVLVTISILLLLASIITFHIWNLRWVY